RSAFDRFRCLAFIPLPCISAPFCRSQLGAERRAVSLRKPRPVVEPKGLLPPVSPLSTVSTLRLSLPLLWLENVAEALPLGPTDQTKKGEQWLFTNMCSFPVRTCPSSRSMRL